MVKAVQGKFVRQRQLLGMLHQLCRSYLRHQDRSGRGGFVLVSY
jgi:hypothetical protein